MTTIVITGKLAERIVNLSKEDDLPEDYNPMDYCGGNFDDAFSAGERRGEIDLCKEIADSCEIKEK